MAANFNRTEWLASLTAGDAVAWVNSNDMGEMNLSAAWVVRRTSTQFIVRTNGIEIRLDANGYRYGKGFDVRRRIVPAPVEGVEAHNERSSREMAAYIGRLQANAARMVA